MGSNQYNIKYSSMDQLYVDICTKTQGWNKQLDSWKTSYIGLINMTSFNGQSATAVKSYLGEVHEFLLQSIYVAISRFQSDYLLYKNKYYAIEDNIYATMSRETIKSIEGKLSNEVKYLNNISNEIDRSLNSISDIYWRGKPSKATLEGYLNSEKSSLVDLNTSIENYENNQYSVANGELKSLLEALKSTIILYSGSTNSVLSYKSGDLCNKTEVLDLYIKVQSSVEHVENNKEEIELAALNQEEVFSQMQKDYEEALEAREDEGRVKMITGVLAGVVGVAAIILTAGAATPIVVTAAVAGTSSVAYGVSNMVEGGQDIYYASIGDLSSAAINPIRDTIFMGNQGAYDVWGNLSMTVAGLCIPVSQSVNGLAGASKATIAKTAAMRIGKELIIDAGIDFASSNVTNFAANQFNLNKTESTLLNLGLSFGLDKSVDSARSKILGEASFAEGMSYDDAKRYNDYWKRVEIGNNTVYPGLTDADIKLWKFADNKLNDNIALNKVNSNEVLKLRMKALELENSLRVVDRGGTQAERLKYYETLKAGVIDDTAWSKLIKYAKKENIDLNSISWDEKVSIIDNFKSDIISNKNKMKYIEDNAKELLELSDIRLEECIKNGYNAQDYFRILNQDKTIRNPDDYLKSLEDTKLIEQWKDMFYGNDSKVVISYMPKDAYDNFVLGYGTIGRPGDKGGQFVLPQNIGDSIETKLSNLGSISNSTDKFKVELAKELGLPEDVFSNGVVRVEIPLDGDINLRVVTGIEDGCNYQWIPGGKTLGGTMEGIIRQITKIDDGDLYNKIISNAKR